MSELLELNRSFKTPRLKGAMIILLGVAQIVVGAWIGLFQSDREGWLGVICFGVGFLLLGFAAPSIAGFGVWALRRAPQLDLTMSAEGIRFVDTQGEGMVTWDLFTRSYQTRNLLVLEVGWRDVQAIPRRACDPGAWPQLVEWAQAAGKKKLPAE